jgi:hypothetical protein
MSIVRFSNKILDRYGSYDHGIINDLIMKIYKSEYQTKIQCDEMPIFFNIGGILTKKSIICPSSIPELPYQEPKKFDFIPEMFKEISEWLNGKDLVINGHPIPIYESRIKEYVILSRYMSSNIRSYEYSLIMAKFFIWLRIEDDISDDKRISFHNDLDFMKDLRTKIMDIIHGKINHISDNILCDILYDILKEMNKDTDLYRNFAKFFDIFMEKKVKEIEDKINFTKLSILDHINDRTFGNGFTVVVSFYQLLLCGEDPTMKINLEFAEENFIKILTNTLNLCSWFLNDLVSSGREKNEDNEQSNFVYRLSEHNFDENFCIDFIIHIISKKMTEFDQIYTSLRNTIVDPCSSPIVDSIQEQYKPFLKDVYNYLRPFVDCNHGHQQYVMKSINDKKGMYSCSD